MAELVVGDLTASHMVAPLPSDVKDVNIPAVVIEMTERCRDLEEESRECVNLVSQLNSLPDGAPDREAALLALTRRSERVLALIEAVVDSSTRNCASLQEALDAYARAPDDPEQARKRKTDPNVNKNIARIVAVIATVKAVGSLVEQCKLIVGGAMNLAKSTCKSSLTVILQIDGRAMRHKVTQVLMAIRTLEQCQRKSRRTKGLGKIDSIVLYHGV